MVTSVKPVRAKERSGGQTQPWCLGSTPCPQASQLPISPPGLDISRLLLGQGPHAFPLPIQLSASAQLPDRLQHLSLCPLEVLCSLGAWTQEVLIQTTSIPELALPSPHPLNHTFRSTCSLALRPVPPAAPPSCSRAPAELSSRRPPTPHGHISRPEVPGPRRSASSPGLAGAERGWCVKKLLTPEFRGRVDRSPKFRQLRRGRDGADVERASRP